MKTFFSGSSEMQNQNLPLPASDPSALAGFAAGAFGNEAAAFPGFDTVVGRKEIQTRTRRAKGAGMRQSKRDTAKSAGSTRATDVPRRTVQIGNTTGKD